MRGVLGCGKKQVNYWKCVTGGMLLLFVSLAWFVCPAAGFELMLDGKPVNFSGYLRQSAQYGTDGNQFDTMDGFQSYLTQALLEISYQPKSNLKFFMSGKANVDWAYLMYNSSQAWKEKQFDKAYNRLFFLSDWQDVLGEAHVSYSNGGFFFRFGKQVVAWGETDGFRLMDQINPLDQRRGLGDVEFENSIIPVWLLRAEFRQSTGLPSWLQELNYQFVFNPNFFEYRGSEGIFPDGNDMYGIWNLDMPGGYMQYVSFMTPGGPVGWVPSKVIPTLPPFIQATAGPVTESNIGSFDNNIQKPHGWSSDGFKYAGRVTGMIADARISINGFYGRDNNWVFAVKPGVPRMETSPWDGRVIIHPQVEAYYPWFKFVGATFSKDLNFIKFNALGNVAPVLRLESIYAFDSTFGKYGQGPSGVMSFEKHDELRWALGLDWKVRIPIINDTNFIMLSPQIYNRRIMDYKTPLLLSTDPYIRENTWMTTIFMRTAYFHSKLTPSFFYIRDWSSRAWMMKPEVAYEPSDTWKYALGALFIGGEKEAKSMWCLRHKDHIYGTISYKF
jgi:hypothetical protein